MTKKLTNNDKEIYFPIDEMKSIFNDKSEEVTTEAASFLSGVLQFLTNKVLDSAVACMHNNNSNNNHNNNNNNNNNVNNNDNNNKSNIICPNKKRKRNNNDNINELKSNKKRKLYPKDIANGLQCNKDLNEWTNMKNLMTWLPLTLLLTLSTGIVYVIYYYKHSKEE